MRHAFWAILLLVPSVAANPGAPVEACSQECAPAEVNPEVRRGDEAVNVILYGHFENLLGAGLLNTQLPDPLNEPDLGARGLVPALTTRLGPCLGATCADFSFGGNVFTMSTIADTITFVDDGWRTHSFPGFGSDVHLAGEEAVLYWYMSASAAPEPPQGAAIGVAPAVGIHARLTPNRVDPLLGSAYAESDDIGVDARTNLITVPGDDAVYEFRVPMRILHNIIPGGGESMGLQAVIHIQQVGARDVQADVAQADFRIHTGARFPPRVILAMERPLATVGSSIGLYKGDLFVRWSVMPALANYDVDESSLRLRQTGGPAVRDDAVDFVFFKRSFDHDGKYKPINVTWRIAHNESRLPDGQYEFIASLRNLQGTYELERTFTFDVKNGEPNVDGKPLVDLRARFPGKSVIPGPVAGTVVVAVILALVRLRRGPGSAIGQ